MNEFQLNIENLEERLLLSGNVFTQGANLIVEGTSAADTVEVRQIGGNLRVLVNNFDHGQFALPTGCLLYTSPSPRDATLSRMPSSA